jgi:RNA-directed DNA polymerase
VRRLQIRIAKAVRENRWNKVKVLQRLLVKARATRLLAVRKVTTNRGRRTPGIDGVLWSTDAQKWKAVDQLGASGYKPKPLRRVAIPKANGKLRYLGIPTMLDRAQQMCHALALLPVAETNADPNSYGFRQHRCVADAIEQAANCLSHKGSAVWILEGDIKACFDRIDHQFLLDRIPMDRTVLNRWLKAGYLENNALHPTPMGTPQGGTISPVIANMVLDGLEAAVGSVTHKRKDKVHFVRYADDFIVTASERTLLESVVVPTIVAFLAERGLELSAEKTRITHIDEGFNFLGVTFRKFKGKLLCRPQKDNTLEFLDSLRDRIKRRGTARTEKLIRDLNRRLRGWSNFYKNVAAKETFSHVDHEVFKALWRWSRRRHPNKTLRWVKDKYFKRLGKQNWVFAATYVDDKGCIRKERLFKTASHRIRRHIKIVNRANPFDPAFAAYYRKRRAMMRTRRINARLQVCRSVHLL